MEPHKVLVADDDKATRLGLQRTLTRHGFFVQTAANGLEAATHLRRSSYDLHSSSDPRS